MRALSLQIGNIETGPPDAGPGAIRVAALGIGWPLIAVPAIGVVGGPR